MKTTRFSSAAQLFLGASERASERETARPRTLVSPLTASNVGYRPRSPRPSALGLTALYGDQDNERVGSNDRPSSLASRFSVGSASNRERRHVFDRAHAESLTRTKPRDPAPLTNFTRIELVDSEAAPQGSAVKRQFALVSDGGLSSLSDACLPPLGREAAQVETNIPRPCAEGVDAFSLPTQAEPHASWIFSSLRERALERGGPAPCPVVTGSAYYVHHWPGPVGGPGYPAHWPPSFAPPSRDYVSRLARPSDPRVSGHVETMELGERARRFDEDWIRSPDLGEQEEPFGRAVRSA